jgi:hypothetical protein
MTTQVRSQLLASLESAARDDFPYPHVIVPELFAPDESEAMLQWLEKGAMWWEQHRDFYTHETCENMLECPLLGEGQPLSRATRAELARMLSQRFAIELDESNVTLGAHRMHPGHGVGIHTDDPALGTESLRLLVTLRRGDYTDAAGGHLCLFTAPEMSALASIVRPRHNSAIAFPLSGTSYHAVNDVTDGIRYSLIFGFWETRKTETIKLPARPARADSELKGLTDSDALLEFLRENGVGRVGHSGATLTDHLIGVAALLLEWGAEEEIVRAGLFHSVYGTATFHTQVFSDRDRERVRAVIGERAEYLVWLFSVVRFAEVYRFSGEENFLARRRDASEPLELTPQDVRDLNLIAFANMVEQLPVTELSPGEIFQWRGALERMRHLFPPNAVQELEKLLNRQAS